MRFYSVYSSNDDFLFIALRIEKFLTNWISVISGSLVRLNSKLKVIYCYWAAVLAIDVKHCPFDPLFWNKYFLLDWRTFSLDTLTLRIPELD
ncbi:unnamed protein product [Allacma fusca]|uniref:Uncharacterized protein n=1 Tax=Allacma fusca TaxID=39272 RepID=A0A8J2JRS8_9HEXA|nr:unnamed protein product [Allacma fusca]